MRSSEWMRTITFVVLSVTMFVLGYKMGQRLESQESPCPSVVDPAKDFNCMKLDGGKDWDTKLCYRARV